MATPFRLARILRLREQVRRLRSHEAEQLAARLVAARSEMARLVAERERLGEVEATAARTGMLTPDFLQVGRTYDARLAAVESARAVDVVRLGEALERKRAELVGARQEEEKYVRLAAAHEARVLEQEARESQRTLDEMAVDRYRRNQKEQSDEQI